MKKLNQDVLIDCRQLSAGTIASLTGKRLYREVDEIRDRLVSYVASATMKFATWHDAWNNFWKNQEAS